MTIPRDDEIQYHCMDLLDSQPDGKMRCDDAYRALAKRFPQLSSDDLGDGSSRSLWRYSVRWSVQHLRDRRHVLHHTVAGGRGVWAISDAGRRWLASLPDADEMLRELTEGASSAA